MRRVQRVIVPVIALAAAASTALLAGTPAATAGKPKPGPGRPDKVVVIVVDALSREIVQKYGMTNVQALMRDGADSPKGYLGHLGSVTVVTHNVLTHGALPKNMGWTDEGYRDVDQVLAGQGDDTSDMWLTSDLTKDQMFALQDHADYPNLADYLHAKRPGSKVVAISPKGYAAWGLGGGNGTGGAAADSIVTFSSRNYDCDGDGVNNWRGPTGVNVAGYLSTPVCGPYYVDSASSKKYDTGQSPAWMYPLDGNRYTAGTDPDHQGSDVWAADAAIDTMKNEDWSGVFVTLPGVDKAAHMWGSIDDDGGDDPQTHLANAAAVADEQVGKIVDQLRTSGELDDTLVVLTADHGSVPGRHFYGVDKADQGLFNWYYGDLENGKYLDPQPALKPLVDTGNVAMSYSDSMLRAWLEDQSPARVAQAVKAMKGLPGVSAVWVRDGTRFRRATPVRSSAMSGPERAWFAKHAQELLDTTAAPYGADVIATLLDDTTYSVKGDHGGIQRRSQQIPIVFAGGGVGSTDLKGGVRSVDIMPTVLKALGIPATHALDGKAYQLPGVR
ncbi:MAG: alkaline phosphatase family protein [Nocardioides sp.]